MDDKGLIRWDDRLAFVKCNAGLVDSAALNLAVMRSNKSTLEKGQPE